VKKNKLSIPYPTDLPSWQALKIHYQDEIKSCLINDLFTEDPQRTQTFSVDSGNLFFDYSKNLLTKKTKELLINLSHEVFLDQAIEAMFQGENINYSEGRPALHVALRSKLSDQIALHIPGVKDIWATLDRMDQFVNRIHSRDLLGYTGKGLTNIVNVGIGGSDLGVMMSVEALKHHAKIGINFYNVSNIDGIKLSDLMDEINIEETLFVIVSKTFTTKETLNNSIKAKQWVTDALGLDAVASHFAAVSTNSMAMDTFGINSDYQFPIWDWVGGRYAITSAANLSLALLIGMKNFRNFLLGARHMDYHFRHTEFGENIPVILALISIWYNNFFNTETQAVITYDERLKFFSNYLQQLQMESGGKSVRVDGRPVKVKTSPILWGGSGSEGQHSYFQLLTQGKRLVPVDFILPINSSGAGEKDHTISIADCLSQSEIMMEGYKNKDLRLCHPGNKPSNTIIFKQLNPESLGQLISLYEHKVFVENVIWGTNPFDQFGVELGKTLSNSLVKESSVDISYKGSNASTKSLLAKIKIIKEK
jgi:glucose-6-phosphate isomerase